MIKEMTCKCGALVTLELPDDRPLLKVTREIWDDLTEVLCDSCRQAEGISEHDGEMRARFDRRLQRSQLPLALRGLGWDTLERKGRGRAIDSARKWAAGDLRGLLLFGDVGVGKTRIAATAARAMLTHRAVRWTFTPGLFARLGAGANEPARRAGLDLLTGIEALVLDDLDKARPTPFGAEQVLAIVDTRITAGAPLLVTTNLTPRALSEKFPDPFGEAISSRLSGYCQVHELGGHDRRLQPVAA